MVCVLNLKTYSFTDKRSGEKGINAGCLVALSKHNTRKEINSELEHKTQKGQNHINIEESHRNVIIQELDYSKAVEIKQLREETKARKDAVGAFSLVFDFKNQDKESFDVAEHQELVEAFLSDIGITERFECLEFVFHFDEKSVHCHLTYSGYDLLEGRFGVNNFFNKSMDEKEPLRDEKGNIVYKKIANGKNRGQFELDADGNKIPKMVTVKKNGGQFLQDSFEAYLEKEGYKYTNKKRYSSLLQFPKGIWRSFDEQTKEDVYYFRELENLYYDILEENPNDPTLEQINDEMLALLTPILEKAQGSNIGLSKQKKAKKSQNLELKR